MDSPITVRAMTPLQKIAMGLVIVLIPANFPANPEPEWAFYDALPDPVGWLLVLLGLRALGRGSSLRLGLVTGLAITAFVISIPLWFPQINHLLVPAYNPDLDVSGQWFLSLPQNLFGFALAREISRAGQEADDGYLSTRFGLLGWAFAALVVLPVIAYGGGVTALQTPTLVLIGVVSIAFIYYLFASHRRPLLAGPGPRDWTGESQKSRPPEGEDGSS